MMGRRQKTISGDEYDLTSRARRRGIIVRRAGGWAWIKTKLNRRWRREHKRELAEGEEP